jgi:hypothetical protein
MTVMSDPIALEMSEGFVLEVLYIALIEWKVPLPSISRSLPVHSSSKFDGEQEALWQQIIMDPRFSQLLFANEPVVSISARNIVMSNAQIGIEPFIKAYADYLVVVGSS